YRLYFHCVYHYSLSRSITYIMPIPCLFVFQFGLRRFLVFFVLLGSHPLPTLFPYTPLFRSRWPVLRPYAEMRPPWSVPVKPPTLQIRLANRGLETRSWRIYLFNESLVNPALRRYLPRCR